MKYFAVYYRSSDYRAERAERYRRDSFDTRDEALSMLQKWAEQFGEPDDAVVIVGELDLAKGHQ